MAEVGTRFKMSSRRESGLAWLLRIVVGEFIMPVKRPFTSTVFRTFLLTREPLRHSCISVSRTGWYKSVILQPVSPFEIMAAATLST